jgi:hypothetical protein
VNVDFLYFLDVSYWNAHTCILKGARTELHLFSRRLRRIPISDSLGSRAGAALGRPRLTCRNYVSCQESSVRWPSGTDRLQPSRPKVLHSDTSHAPPWPDMRPLQ